MKLGFTSGLVGRDSTSSLIPTASLPDTTPPEMVPEVTAFLERRMKERLGVSTVTVLHTYDRARSDRDSFAEPLRRATGVWMLGGFPERLVHSYLNTKTELAMRELLDRGGVVGGESTGAMIQGSWLDSTDSEFTPAIRALMQAILRINGVPRGGRSRLIGEDSSGCSSSF